MIEAKETVVGSLGDTKQSLSGSTNVSNTYTSDYTLPIASETILGGIKVGDNLSIDPNGKLNANIPPIPANTSDLNNDSGFITEIPTEYITEEDLDSKGYLTSVPSDYKTKEENDALYQPKGEYGNLEYNYVVDGVRLYVDGANGNDETGDGSETKPFKSINRLFEIANNLSGGRVDIRCYIVSPGEYVIEKHSIANLILHITGSVGGVILKFTTDRDVKFYQCHCNFQNITIDAPNATEIGFDGSNVACGTCTFKQIVKVYGGGGYFNKCIFNYVKAYYSNIEFKGSIEITNTSPTIDAFYFNNCVIRMSGTVTLAKLTSSGTGVNCYLYCNNTFLTLQNAMPDKTYRYNYGFYGAGNIVVTRKTYLDSLLSESVSGIKMTNIPTLFVDIDTNARLANYASKDEIPTKLSDLTNDKGFLTSIPSEYITESELASKGYLTSVPSEYITETELTNELKDVVRTDSEARLKSLIVDDISCKNKFIVPETKTVNGITFTNNGDGTFNLSGTATANAEFKINANLSEIGLISGETYTLSSNVERDNFYVTIASYKDSTWLSTLMGLLVYDGVHFSTKTVTYDSSTNKIAFIITVLKDATINLTNVKLQLEEGNEVTEWVARKELNLQHYSDNEKIIGTWFGKPLYRKTIYISSIATGEQTIAHNIENIDICYLGEGSFFIFDSMNFVPLNYLNHYEDIINHKVSVRINRQTILTYIGVFNVGATASGVFSIYYTKTTD